VQRQYTGTAGRIENAQVAVYLGYASAAGYALVDRELYLPRSWTGDRARCEAAGIPQGTAFAAKPELAWRMIGRAVAGGVAFGWFAGDEVYGDNGKLRTRLEAAQIRYVLAVSCAHRVPAGAGRTLRAGELATRLPRRAWQRTSAGMGAKGQRYYDWAWVTVRHPGPGRRWLLIHRHRRTGELAFYRCYAPQPVTLAALVAIAGRRWTIEENIQAGKGLAGLDEHQVRTWTSWHRMRWSAWRRRHLQRRPAHPPADGGHRAHHLDRPPQHCRADRRPASAHQRRRPARRRHPLRDLRRLHPAVG
jgi:SRSO17 transposase